MRIPFYPAPARRISNIRPNPYTRLLEATIARRDYGEIRHLANITGFQIGPEIHDLREAGVEVWILPEPFLVPSTSARVNRSEQVEVISLRCLSIS